MSVLGNAIEFLQRFGVFDIVLPFLLVFAVVFGILEKTRILGEEKEKGEEQGRPRKNLDAIVAFVLALLVVASTKIVGVINEALPKVSLLVVVSLSFLISIGIFMKPGNTFYERLGNKWLTFLMVVMFIAIILIFLSVIPANANESWLEYAFNYTVNYWDETVVSSIVLFIVIIFAIWFITRGEGKKK